MSPGKKWARAALVLSITALLGSAGWVLWLLGERDSRLPKLALTLPEERKRARAAGLPLSFDDLPKRAAVAEKDNAAPLYREAATLAPVLTPQDWQVLRRLQAEKGTDSDTVRGAVLTKVAAVALARVRVGVTRPHCDFGWRGELGEEGWKQRRQTLLALDSLAMILQTDHSLESLDTVQRLTRHLTEEQGLLVWNLRTRHRSFAMETLLKWARENPALLPKLEVAWRSWSLAPGALQTAWMLQCVKEQGDSLRNRTKPYKPEKEPLLDYNPLWRELDRLDHTLGWKLYADASEVINLRYWRNVKQVLEPFAESDLRGQWRALKKLDEQEEQRAKEIPGYWYPQLYSRLFDFILFIDCSWSVSRTEHALMLWKQTRGHYPARLTELPSETPITDPYTGKQLLWDGTKLYSVGRDEHDDRGDEKKDIVRDLSKAAASPLRRSRLGAIRRPGRTAGQVE